MPAEGCSVKHLLVLCNSSLMAAGNGMQYVLLQTQTSIATCSDPSVPSEMRAACQKYNFDMQWPAQQHPIGHAGYTVCFDTSL